MQMREAADETKSGVLLRRFLRQFWPLLAICAIVVVAVHQRERAQDRALAKANARGVLAVQQRMLDHELSNIASTLRYLAGSVLVGEFVQEGKGRASVERDLIALCEHSPMFDQVRILDERGFEMLRVERGDGKPEVRPEDELQSKADRYYFQAARELADHEIYVSPFDLNVEHGVIETPWRPVIRLLTPVGGSEPPAVIVLNYLGDELLDRLQAAGQSLVGWSSLVDAGGYFLEGPTRDASWGFMFDSAPTFAQAHPEMWKRIEAEAAQAQGEVGIHVGAEGMFAFKSFQPDDGSREWRSDLKLTLVSLTPNRLLYENSDRILRMLLLAASATLLLLGAGSWRLALASEHSAGQERQLEKSHGQLRVLSNHLLEAQEKERQSLSRDLHDELGQIATVVTINLKQAQLYPERRDSLLQKALDDVEQMLAGMRKISTKLRTSLLDDLGLKDALLEHCETFAHQAKLKLNLTVNLEDSHILPGADIHVFRIVQESLNNVLRHAVAFSVTIRVESTEMGVSIKVSDDGSGFDAEKSQSGSLGIEGMRERVDLLGGQFEIHSELGKGTTVEAWIPSKKAKQEEGVL